MAQSLTVQTARSNLQSALVAGVSQPYTPKAFPKLAYGETIDVNLFLVDSGNYDTRSGVTGYTPRLSVTLDDQTPKDGTFTISNGDDSYIVSGAGTTAANGQYDLIETQFNNHPVWQYSNNGTLYFIRRETHDEHNVWHIVQADSATQTPANLYLYSDGNTGSGPKLTGWTVDDDGAADAPTLTLLIATTSLLDYDASSTEIEAALNALHNNQGPSYSTVSVDKFGNGAFSVRFDELGVQELLTADVSAIRPISSVSVSRIVSGNATKHEEQLILINADALVQTTSGVEITNGWTVTIDATGTEILRAITAAQGDISENFTIEIVEDSTQRVDVVAKGPVILLADH